MSGIETINNIAPSVARGVRAQSGDCRKRCCKVEVFINRVGALSSTVRRSPRPAAALVRDRQYAGVRIRLARTALANTERSSVASRISAVQTLYDHGL